MSHEQHSLFLEVYVMRSRQEIKSIGKQRFIANYWPCVGVIVVVSLAIGLVGGILSIPGMIQGMRDGNPDSASSFSLLSLLIAGPLTIGLNYFFIKNLLGRVDELSVTTPFTEAFTNYGRKLGGYMWMLLFTLLWGLLFIIPGIIKSYSYALAPYILADCPNVKAKDALKLSMRIMAGHKWELFVFHLSFIGWDILSAFTVGLLGVFFVQPYIYSASACWYLEAREEALRTGVITMAQLEGREDVI